VAGYDQNPRLKAIEDCDGGAGGILKSKDNSAQ